MADGEDIQPLVCDNGTGMVKVCWNLTEISNLESVCIVFSPFLFGHGGLFSLCFLKAVCEALWQKAFSDKG